MIKKTFTDLLASGLRCAVLASMGLGVVAQATCLSTIKLTLPDSRYQLVSGASPAGSEVYDSATGFVWQRCVLGMTWDNSSQSCTGSGSKFNWRQALEAARTASASTAAPNRPWRLPSHAELDSLVERACAYPAINSKWFAGVPSSETWSSSPVVYDPDNAWVLHFGDGRLLDAAKSNSFPVRLMRLP